MKNNTKEPSPCVVLEHQFGGIKTMQELYCKNCVQILTDGICFFLRYDGGEVTTCIQEICIPESAAKCIVQMKSAQEILNYIHSSFSNELKNARNVSPHEYVGNTMKLIMG